MNIESIIGYMAATFTTISFLPQVIRVVLTKKTEDISRNMYILLNLGVCLWLTYGIMKIDLPIVIANGITLFFSFTILVFKLKEKKQ